MAELSPKATSTHTPQVLLCLVSDCLDGFEPVLGQLLKLNPFVLNGRAQPEVVRAI